MGISIYKIKKWYKMLAGQSILHVDQGIGKQYCKDSLGGYYNDLTEKVLKEKPETMIPLAPHDSGKLTYFSICIFQFGLAAYDLYLRDKDPEMLKKALACGAWALENQQPDGAWVSFPLDYPDRPYSAMAQGEGASLLLRLAKETGDENYLNAARAAVNFLKKPKEEGGVTEFTGDGLALLYEFTERPLVLNGWIFALWGLYDYRLVEQDPQIDALYEKALAGLLAYLPRFDQKYWSRYDLTKRIASPFYHDLHIAQLQAMYDLTGEGSFIVYAEKWDHYRSKRLNRFRALVVKACQKILE